MATEHSVMAVIRAYKPVFRNAHDKVAFAVHASFLASGYVLNATGPPALSDDALYSASTDEAGIDRWNESEDEYGFVYLNPNKGSKKVLVKCLAMDDMLFVDAVSDDGSKPVHLEIKVGDYVEENGGDNYSSQFKNLGKLVNIIDKEMLTKLNGSSTTSTSTQSLSSETRAGQRDIPIPIDVGVAEPHYPQPYPSGFVPPLGGSDLFPGPPPGVFPTRGGFGSGGGMFVGPDHPLFGGIGGDPGFPRGQPGIPSGIPPGARFDPYGPPNVPGFEPNRFVRNPPRRPGGGNHPDLEHYRDGSDFI
ncbi:probable proteasome inhibitor [Cornus florida]|uniref:probable proteasome inhibitor n=1 Tax=Cornus florida TaxID=4283 RepID=UPI00289EE2D9|nr:probable proteasome inhibitor [Cornus florida]